jgi:hypothetical protein
VFYFEGHIGRGKIASWEECQEDATKRDAFGVRRGEFVRVLPDEEKARLALLSSDPYTSTVLPGTSYGCVCVSVCGCMSVWVYECTSNHNNGVLF